MIASTVRASGGRSARSISVAPKICARVLARFSRPISARRSRSTFAICQPQKHVHLSQDGQFKKIGNVVSADVKLSPICATATPEVIRFEGFILL
jgi:hypothetical protein